MSVVLHRVLVAPTWVFTAPPLIAAVAFGLTAHRHRTRKARP